MGRKVHYPAQRPQDGGADYKHDPRHERSVNQCWLDLDFVQIAERHRRQADVDNEGV
jgi:hypothetical protein